MNWCLCSLVWQYVPVYPGTHEQVYLFTPSLHVPPFWQGEDAHSLISIERNKEEQYYYLQWTPAVRDFIVIHCSTLGHKCIVTTPFLLVFVCQFFMFFWGGGGEIHWNARNVYGELKSSFSNQKSNHLHNRFLISLYIYMYNIIIISNFAVL